MSVNLSPTSMDKAATSAFFFGSNLISFAMILEIVKGFDNLEKERIAAVEAGNHLLVAQLEAVMREGEKTMETSDFWESDFAGQA